MNLTIFFTANFTLLTAGFQIRAENPNHLTTDKLRQSHMDFMGLLYQIVIHS